MLVIKPGITNHTNKLLALVSFQMMSEASLGEKTFLTHGTIEREGKRLAMIVIHVLLIQYTGRQNFITVWTWHVGNLERIPIKSNSLRV